MRMSIPVFLEFVEIKTKLASLFPFVLGTLFTIYHFGSFDGLNTALFFVAMVVFDMATTAINNTMDYIKAKNVMYREEENILGKANISVKKAATIIVAMISLAALVGVFLAYRTNLLLLFIGAACFLIGILYTFGPFPISRMPLGEVASGLTMGFGIFFIAVFVNVPADTLASLLIRLPLFTINGNIVNLLIVGLQSLPLVFTIANIMLANNLCDYETDLSNHRYTLTFYIGKPIAIRLYAWLYYGAFAATTASVLLGVYPLWLLLIWLVFPTINQNIARFKAKQDKATTFNLAIKNLVLYHGMEIVLLVLSLILK
jgi:1,4-dihydroxy-2-naphthoate polyprenyltransferase